MNAPAPHRRGVEWSVRGVVAAFLLVTVVLLGLTQTRWGREQILKLTLNAAAGRLQGTLAIRELDGGLLTGAKLYGIVLRDPEGQPLLRVDSAAIRYDLVTLLRGDILLERLALFGPEIVLRHLPGDTLWNYQELTVPPADTTAPARAVLLRRATLQNAQIVLQMPWAPDSALTPAARDSAIRTALSDTSTIVVRRVPGGFLQTRRLLISNAALSDGAFGGGDRGGTFLRVDQLEGAIAFGRESVAVRQFEGAFALRAGRLEFRVDPLVLSDSRLVVYGVAVLGGDTARYDVMARAERLAFSDLQPILPQLPEQGSAAGLLSVETRPGGTLYRVRNLRLEAPGTLLHGRFGALLGDTLRFVDTELEAPRLNVPLIEQLLPDGLPVRGLRIGSAVIR